jgi:hypothetical protein
VANANNTCTAGQCAYTCSDGFCDFGNGSCVANDTIAACGPSCTACPVDPNGTPECVSASAGAAPATSCADCACRTTCNTGYCPNQAGSCAQTDVQTDANNCGSCGTVCPSDPSAFGGTPLCDAGGCSLDCPTYPSDGGSSFACNGKCNDTVGSTDPHNCHACGNDCQGGWCGSASFLGITDTLPDGGSGGCRYPFAAPDAGVTGPPVEIVGSPNEAVAYWIDNSGSQLVMEWDPSAGRPQQLTVGGGGAKSNLIVTQDQYGENELVWLEADGSGSTASTGIWEYTIGGSSPNPRQLTSVPASSFIVTGLTADKVNAYFTLTTFDNSYVARAPLNAQNGAYTLLTNRFVGALGEIVWLPVGDVYFFDTNNDIYSVNTASGSTGESPVLITSNAGSPSGQLTTDGNNLYFLSSPTTVSEVNLASTFPTTPTVIRSGLTNATSLVGYFGSGRHDLFVNSGNQVIDIGPNGTGTTTYDTGVRTDDFAFANFPGGGFSFASAYLFMVGESDNTVYAISGR